jgi:23S rRNA (pseudouridine1915-N3)-methyltransferase
MRVRLVAVGRVRDAVLREACEHYLARVRQHLPLEVTEVREAGRTDRDAANGRRAEAEALLRSAGRGTRLVALSREGVAESSERFARRLEGWQLDARNVALLLGGAHGLDRQLLERSDEVLSLSTLTLPHELARLVLLEQLYRAGTILRREPYHKGEGS